MSEPRVVLVPCFICRGTGDCLFCLGNGEGDRHYEGSEYMYSDPCPSCEGTGECITCGGKGLIEPAENARIAD